jgi:hypothetical protein
MLMTNGRYGRPKGSGLDDRLTLASIAALIAANPKLKPTTAIRSLGVEAPSDIRRLRDKFRLEQAKLMADARRAPRLNGARPLPLHKGSGAGAPGPASSQRPPVPSLASNNASRSAAPGALFAAWCDLAVSAASAAVEHQAVLAHCWLRLPPVATAMRGQLVLNAIGVAIYTRSRRSGAPYHH